MKITQIKNLDGSLAKEIRSDGTIISSAHLQNGEYSTFTVESLNEFNSMLNGLKYNEAITLGITEIESGLIVSKNIFDSQQHTITRSKEYFSFHDESILLFDIDSDDGDNFQCKSHEEVIEILTQLDPQFEEAEILIRHSSSSFIYKWEKGSRTQVKGIGSFHIYVKAINVKNSLYEYVKRLEDRAFELGYGYFKVSKTGSMLKRQIFDSAVFSPERLIFEAGMVCHEPYEQDRPEEYYREGNFIDCEKLPLINNELVEANIALEKNKKEVISKEVQESYIETEKQKLIKSGYSVNEAHDAIEMLLQEKCLHADYKISLADKSIISIKDIYMYPEKYDSIQCYDPIEPEKGAGKAMIYSNDGINPIVHSFIHGGINYKLKINYDTLIFIVDNYDLSTELHNDKLVQRLKILAVKADLSDDHKKEIGRILKTRKIAPSINCLLLSTAEKINDAQNRGYIDITPKGNIAPTVDNLKVLMDNNKISYKHDVILKNTDIMHESIDAKGPNKENAIISVLEKFAYNEGIDPKIVNNISSLANKEYKNPLLDYIKQEHIIYTEKYNVVNFIGQVAKTLKGNEVTQEYIEALIKKWMIQCIAAWDYERTSICDGAKQKYESVLVLQGKQGIQKTKFISSLLPIEIQHYIKTGAMLNPADKDSLMQNTSYAIVELGELDTTFRKSDIGALKAFLSNSVDEYRAPYAKTATKHKRCTSYCASVNETGFLRDPTGSRRFWVLPLESIDFDSYEKINKGMLWAQAFDLYLRGERWWFDDILDDQMSEFILTVHRNHMALTYAEEVVIIIQQNNSSAEWLSATKIYERFSNRKPTQTDLNDLATLLTGSGYERNSRKEFFVPTERIEAKNNTFMDKVMQVN